MMRYLIILLAAFGLVLAGAPGPAKPRHASAGHKTASRAKRTIANAGSRSRSRHGATSSRGGHRVAPGRRGRRSRSYASATGHVSGVAPSDDLGSAPETASLSIEAVQQAAVAAAARGDSAEALSRYLHVLSRRPDDQSALIGAGRAALDVGDLNAATGFFAHAQDIAPQNGEVEAGLGAVAVQNNDPRAALRYLRSAEQHGVAAAALASDRALAYDLAGNPRRAQAEYAVALRAKPGNAALLRRLALSQAAAGDRLAAFNTLDPLLRRQDIAAWRTRAFVRAMTGDVAGAEEDAATVVPASQLPQLKPYLARLATLRPAEKAVAVNLGRFPQPGGTTQIAQAAPPRLPFDLEAISGTPAAAGGIAAVTGRAQSQPQPQPQSQPYLQPQTMTSSAVGNALVSSVTVPVTGPAGLATGDLPALRRSPSSAPLVEPKADRPRIAISSPAAQAPSPPPPPAVAPAPAVVATSSAGASIVPDMAASPAPLADRPRAPVSAAPSSTASVSSAIVTKPTARPAPLATSAADAAKTKAEARAAALAGQREKERRATAAAAAAEAAEQKKLARANPARSWVQVAGGANKADLPKEWAKLRKKWPKQLGDRSPWTAHYRFTNRLLIGPFASTGAAQSWVSERKQEGFATFRVDTDAGEPVERLGG